MYIWLAFTTWLLRFFFFVLARNVGDRDGGEGLGGCKYHVHDYVADQRLDRLLATTVAVCH